MKAQCPECDTDIEFKPGAELGDSVTCPECGTQLEIISLKPAELDYALDLEDEETEDEEELGDEDELEEDDDWDEEEELEEDDLWDEDEDEDEDDDY